MEAWEERGCSGQRHSPWSPLFLPLLQQAWYLHPTGWGPQESRDPLPRTGA